MSRGRPCGPGRIRGRSGGHGLAPIARAAPLVRRSPNERSLHERPVPATGGIAILAGVGGRACNRALPATSAPGYAGCSPAPSSSFPFHLRTTSGGSRSRYASSPISRPPPAWCSPACRPNGSFSPARPSTSAGRGRPRSPSLFVAWLVNLYNFMDGMDGFAAGMTAIGFATLAVLCAGQGAAGLAAVKPGDRGSGSRIPPVQLPACEDFHGRSRAPRSWGISVRSRCSGPSVPRPFHCGSPSSYSHRSSSMHRSPSPGRTIAGQRPWRAHRGHFYQRLVLLGWGHRKTVVREYGLMLACACSAIAALRLPPGAQGALLGAWVVAYVVLTLCVTRLERRAEA